MKAPMMNIFKVWIEIIYDIFVGLNVKNVYVWVSKNK